MLEVIERGDAESLGFTGEATTPDEVRLHTPTQNPQKTIAIEMNYRNRET